MSGTAQDRRALVEPSSQSAVFLDARLREHDSFYISPVPPDKGRAREAS
jgi:hypothetical protein